MSRQDEGMQPRGLERALDLAAARVAEVDLAEQAWRRGRAARGRERVVVSGLVVAALGLGAVGWSTLTRHSAEDVAPAATSAAPDAVEQRLRDRAAGVRGSIEAACLEQRGWEVVPAQGGGWASAEQRPQRGQDPGPADLQGDLADCEVATGMTARVETSIATGDLAPEDEATIRAVYRSYAAAARCVERELYSYTPVPDEWSFLSAYPPGSSPPWHPYLNVSSAVGVTTGGPFRAAELCPIEITWDQP